jgi:ABC-type uncharacterized transport system YnjBCD permease subunit
MVTILKIMLILLCLASIALKYFVVREFRLWKRSPEADEASVFERLLVSTISFVVFIFLLCVTAVSGLVVFSDVTVALPF